MKPICKHKNLQEYCIKCHPKNTKKDKVVKAWIEIDIEGRYVKTPPRIIFKNPTAKDIQEDEKYGYRIYPCTIHYKITNKKK